MSRSKWKGPYTVSKKISDLKHINSVELRNVEITPKLVGLTFKIHNGKEYQEILVIDDMIGHKFGEFVFTRGKFSFKKKKK